MANPNFDITLEGFIPGVKNVAGAVNTNLPIVATSTVSLSGNVSAPAGSNTFDFSASSGTFKTSTGVTTIGGNLVVTGSTTSTGGKLTTVVTTALVGATVVLTAANSGTTYLQASTSGTPSFTLPAVASGIEYTFITTSVTNGYTITTGTASLIHAKTSASGTAITSTATTGSIVNTQATAVVGDMLSLICDGTNWWMTKQSGIFAST